MGKIENVFVRDKSKALRRKRNDLAGVDNIGIANAFKTRLPKLAEAAQTRRNAVNVFAVIYFRLTSRLNARIFYY